MTQASGSSSSQHVQAGTRMSPGRILRAMEIDVRLVGMILALAVILVGFGIYTGGRFLSPSNLSIMAVQTASTAIIATGMVFVIVSRNIDLSVGSIVGVVAMTQAVLMAKILSPDVIGADLRDAINPLIWVVALAVGLGLGALIGGFQGFIIAYIGVPSFIVTLGGLLAFRGATWLVTRGETVSPVDPTFKLLGGGPVGSLGAELTWILAIGASIAIVGLLYYNRRRRHKYGFPVRPAWADVALGALGVAAVTAVAVVANNNFWPPSLANRWAEANGVTVPEGGLTIQAGIPWPVIIIIVVGLVMTFIANRRRFGRYVYAIGGNPEAAELAGINVRWTIMKTFILMGVLCALAASISAARLDGATLDLGEGMELYVIAAAVVGGTSFAGGIGTVTGAIVGALVMQSLAYGMNFVGLSSPIQDIVAGGVLVIAVGIDTINRRRN